MSKPSILAQVAAWEWEVENDRLRLSVSIDRLLELPEPIHMIRELDFISLLDEESAERMQTAMRGLIVQGKPFDLVLSLSIDDVQHQIELHAGVSERVGDRVTRVGGVAARAGVPATALESSEVHSQIAKLVDTDVVTGLLNRDAFYRMADKLSTCTQGTCTILSLRIGEIGLVNETCSLDDGDELLREVAEIIRALTPDDALLARIGGGRFLILLSQPVGSPQVAAEKINDGLRDYQFTSGEHVFSLSAAIGLATRASSSEPVAELVAKARSASGLAASQGRNQIQTYDPSDTDVQRHTGDLEWSARLHAALVEGNFVLYQQPIEPMRPSTDMRLVELLLRMQGPNGELIMPNRFIPVAERHRLMTTVDRWVVREALPLLSQLPEDVGFVLNVSGQSLGETGFFSFIADQLNLTGVDPQRVAFEITETAAIGDLERALRFISIYRGLGCKFLLDDVGSGTNSLSNLRRLPVDMVKIEGAFVRGMLSDKVDEVIVRSVHEIAKASDMLTIAESVESKDALARLREIGVDYAQGYWIGKPQPLAVTSLAEALRQAKKRVEEL